MYDRSEKDLFYSLLAMTSYVSLGPAHERALHIYNMGLPRKKSANIMNVSEHTFAWYIRQVREKFKVSTRSELQVLQQVLMSKKVSSACQHSLALHLKGDEKGWFYHDSDLAEAKKS